MAVRFRPFGEQVRFARVEVEREFQQIVAATARREHTRIMATEPRPLSFFRFVDGREGASENDVREFGVIRYEYPRIDLVATYALQVLREISPFGWPEGGHYRDQHRLFIAGTPASGLDGWRPGQEVAIVNIAPYARVIEVGAMRMVVPGTDHVYAQALQRVRRVYSSVASVKFAWRGGQPALTIWERRG